MKKIVVVIQLILFNMTWVYAQQFEGYVSPPLGKEERVFRDYALGLKVVDEIGKELRRTEPVFSKVFYYEGFDLAAVCLPLNTVEHDEKEGFERGRVWLCLDYDLKPVFVFPSNTHHIYKISDGLFIYKDKPEHYSTVGLVDRDGKVIFEAPYERIYLEEDRYVGVKDMTEDDGYSEIRKWAVVFRKKSSDATFIIKLKTPKDESVGLWFEVKDEEDKEWFEQRLKEDAFHRGLNHVVHSRMKEATECFKECLNSKNPEIVRCAEYNIEALSWYIW